MKSLLTSLAALALLVVPVAPASAIETGTPAWTLKALTLFQGPGTEYDTVGDVAGKIRIRVDRCSDRWCMIHSGRSHGWVAEYDLSFGREPVGPFAHAFLNYKGSGPGRACFYDGHGYTGASICGGPGFEVRDLLLQHMDNQLSSLSIDGNVSVMACRDRDFKSYCERINNSEPALQGFLDDSVTSFRVY